MSTQSRAVPFRFVTAAIALAAAALLGAAPAQAWTDKPVKILVPAPAGGTMDVVARLLGDQLTTEIGQPMVIDNKPGAGGTIAAADVARSPGDGYTVMMTLSDPVVNAVALFKSLPYDPARDELVLIEQFRPGAYAAPGFRPWLVEIVAGIIEPGEEPEEVARRETHEEAGCELHAMRPIFDYIASPGGTTHSVKLYLGRVDSSKAQGIHGLSDEHEDIRVLVVPFADWPALQQEGRISDACSLLALQWLALNRDEVRATWTP